MHVYIYIYTCLAIVTSTYRMLVDNNLNCNYILVVLFHSTGFRCAWSRPTRSHVSTRTERESVAVLSCCRLILHFNPNRVPRVSCLSHATEKKASRGSCTVQVRKKWSETTTESGIDGEQNARWEWRILPVRFGHHFQKIWQLRLPIRHRWQDLFVAWSNLWRWTTTSALFLAVKARLPWSYSFEGR